MKRLTLCLLLLGMFSFGFTQRTLDCNVCLSGTSSCNTTFTLSPGTTYTFTTSVTTGAVYSWTVTGNLSIVGASNQSSVQVQAGSGGSGRICIFKVVDGGGYCCACYDVVIPSPPQCPLISTVDFLNNPNVPNVWCCTHDENFLQINFTPTNSGASATVTILDAPGGNILSQFFNVPGGMPVIWPNGITISNQHPPPCGDYWIYIQNECNPQDVLGFPFQVVQCPIGKPAPTTGEVKEVSVKMQVYPNPVTEGTLTVKLSGLSAESRKDKGSVTFRLVSVAGFKESRTWSFEGMSDQFEINTAELAKGVYFLVTNVGGKNVGTKVVIQ